MLAGKPLAMPGAVSMPDDGVPEPPATLAARAVGDEWLGHGVSWPDWLVGARGVAGATREPRDGPKPVEAHSIATLYRELRKGREDAKDEPGASDLYYGEMEMRRAAPAPRGEGPATVLRWLGEHLLLSTYWLTAGYGQRASRALICLLVTVLLFGTLFWLFGFQRQPEFMRALLFSAASTSSLFKITELKGNPLTYGGEWLQLSIRIIGPLFFGLTLLALRSRVKR